MAFGVLQQLCGCIVKSLSAATHCAGAAEAIAIYCPLVCAFSMSSVPKGLDLAAVQVSGFWKGVCMRAAAAFFKALAGRFVGSGLLSYWLPGTLELRAFLLWASWNEGGHVLGLRIQRTSRIVEVTVRARQSRPSLRCGHVLGLRFREGPRVVLRWHCAIVLAGRPIILLLRRLQCASATPRVDVDAAMTGPWESLWLGNSNKSEGKKEKEENEEKALKRRKTLFSGVPFCYWTLSHIAPVSS